MTNCTACKANEKLNNEERVENFVPTPDIPNPIDAIPNPLDFVSGSYEALFGQYAQMSMILIIVVCVLLIALVIGWIVLKSRS